jgi:ADP-ribose pyrophosphatase
MDDERIETRWFSRRDLDQQIRTGKLQDAKTMLGFLTWQRDRRP